MLFVLRSQVRRELLYFLRRIGLRLYQPECATNGIALAPKASFNVPSYPADDQVILTALKTYGMILADNAVRFSSVARRTRVGMTPISTC
jgi:hypothetical protein